VVAELGLLWNRPGSLGREGDVLQALTPGRVVRVFGLARDITAYYDGGAYSSTGPIAVSVPFLCMEQAYRMDNVRFNGYRIFTNKPIRGMIRIHGRAFGGGVDLQLDMIGERLNINPVEMRLRNARQPGDTTPTNAKPLLLVCDDPLPTWIILGAIDAARMDWLRALAAGKRAADMSPEEWRARVALVVSHLNDPEPLAADLAYAELGAAPYAALRTAKPLLDAAVLRRWLADPEFAARRPLPLRFRHRRRASSSPWRSPFRLRPKRRRRRPPRPPPLLPPPRMPTRSGWRSSARRDRCSASGLERSSPAWTVCATHRPARGWGSAPTWLLPRNAWTT